MIITIDGPAGAGKSTVARRIAKELSLPYLNSGALYRAITWRVLAEGGRFEDRELVRRIIDDLDIRFVENERGSRVILSGVDVTRELQEPRVASQVHRIASVPEYREMLIDVQRAFAREEGCVTDGRDMGSVIFPHADIKVYLDASPEERARRRFLELDAGGGAGTYDGVLADIRARDERDRCREVAPLCVPPGAVVIESDGLSIDEVVARILALVSKSEKA
ncbi:MAG TPA: (d)CMP kinase [Planctomycetota bacterium]|nr:(d)CMP kinase [Planctomycetota bacterium]